MMYCRCLLKFCSLDKIFYDKWCKCRWWRISLFLLLCLTSNELSFVSFFLLLSLWYVCLSLTSWRSPQGNRYFKLHHLFVSSSIAQQSSAMMLLPPPYITPNNLVLSSFRKKQSYVSSYLYYCCFNLDVIRPLQVHALFCVRLTKGSILCLLFVITNHTWHEKRCLLFPVTDPFLSAHCVHGVKSEHICKDFIIWFDFTSICFRVGDCMPTVILASMLAVVYSSGTD